MNKNSNMVRKRGFDKGLVEVTYMGGGLNNAPVDVTYMGRKRALLLTWEGREGLTRLL